MFTGLIESVGRINTVARTDAGLELRIECDWNDLEEGESVAVNGACLTVLDHGGKWFTVAAMAATLGRTAIPDWTAGRRVNLERALRAGARLGGHIVQGHVDGVGVVSSVSKQADSTLIDVVIPPELAGSVILHGSVALDGVSLTVNRLDGDKLQVALIDYTLGHTALGDLGRDSRVHVETDVIGKYVRGLLEPYLNRQPVTGQGR